MRVTNPWIWAAGIAIASGCAADAGGAVSEGQSGGEGAGGGFCVCNAAEVAVVIRGRVTERAEDKLSVHVDALVGDGHPFDPGLVGEVVQGELSLSCQADESFEVGDDVLGVYTFDPAPGRASLERSFEGCGGYSQCVERCGDEIVEVAPEGVSGWTSSRAQCNAACLTAASRRCDGDTELYDEYYGMSSVPFYWTVLLPSDQTLSLDGHGHLTPAEQAWHRVEPSELRALGNYECQQEICGDQLCWLHPSQTSAKAELDNASAGLSAERSLP